MALPFLGVGLSYRWELNQLVAKNAAAIDWLEITPEHFLPLTPDAQARLELLARKLPIAGHSLELSVGADGVDEPGYRDSVARIAAITKSAWHGDHLCFTRAGELPVRALTPVPFNDQAVEVAARNAAAAQRLVGLPFVVENIAYYFPVPTTSMDEAEFLTRVVRAADCGLLLDLHNLHTNAVNHGFDPISFLDRIPLDRVVQIHLAGGERFEDLYLDTHTSCAPEAVWSLLEAVLPRCPVRGINFEMDGRFPPAARLLEELARARALVHRCGAHLASA
jgi:uncharacterized protein (UPF0276 family)